MTMPQMKSPVHAADLETLNDYVFASESVSEGHPDKVCDGISDAIVDLYLSKDPQSRVAVETLATTNKVILAGETRCRENVSTEELVDTVRNKIKSIGYDQERFSWRTVDVECMIHEQSADIARGVDEGDNKEEGAGDQGIMFGFATDETEGFMPAPLFYSHRILRKLAEARHDGTLPMIEPDSKSQFSIAYRNGLPVGCTSIVLSTQHRDGYEDQIHDIVKPMIENILPEGWMTAATELYINPTGKFVIGGPDGDTGLTGRKIIVDTYGGAAPHGGGAFSGKDPTKVDRSAAYATRYLAKNVVAAGLAKKCTIQVSYAIGIAKPLSLFVNLHGTGEVSEHDLGNVLRQMMDLSPKGIRTHLQLNRPIYEPTSAYGHFGRKPTEQGHFSWEKTDLVDALRRHYGVR